ncbi:MAG TPA: hypothetical protein VHV49_13860 [Pseudonocardiaceae bacterium]|jgi:hypothetical protein|nr:hypothetical protein [Pseudonocardiaceae bacterium]HEX3827123.1 hypothetical protein [Sporichthyaceae bacterium]
MSITTGNPPTREAGVMDSTNSFWHSRRTLAAGLVLVAVAIGATWAAVDRSQDSHPGAAGYDSACGLHGGSTATPTTGPDVQWQNIDGNWLPVSTTEGPGRRSATGPWSCYAHTPTGAVLAALDIAGRMNREDLTSVVQQQTVPGPGQAALLAGGVEAAATNEVPAGFDINAYDGSTTTITLYARKGDITGRCSTGLQWIGGRTGDWALRLAPDGSNRVSCEQVTNDQHDPNFIAWGPNQ